MTQGVGGPQQPQYETYVQSWSQDTMAALRAMNINANTTIDISFASFHFTWPKGPMVQPKWEACKCLRKTSRLWLIMSIVGEGM